jgi:hypothetical protein
MDPAKRAKKVISSLIKRGKAERKNWDRWTSWFTGDFYTDDPYDTSVASSPDDNDLTFETNYAYGFIDTMISNICPTNPQVTIDARDPLLKEAAQSRELLINDTIRAEKLHKKLWDSSTFAAICQRGWLKTFWSLKKNRPSIIKVDPRRVFFDMSSEFEDTRFIFEAVPLTASEFKKKVDAGEYDGEVAKKVKAGKMPEWMVDSESSEAFCEDSSRDVFEWIVVYEYYDLVERKFLHMIEGHDQPLWMGDLPNDEMGHPFTLQVFNSNLRNPGGLSDIKLIERLQERLNELDTLELNFAHKTIPFTIVNETLLDDPESAKSMLAGDIGPNDIVSLKTIGDAVPITAVITHTQTPQLSPSFERMRGNATGAIEFTLGLPQYQRGATGKSDVATELALVDTAAKTRNGRRVKVIEDVVIDVAKKVLLLWKQRMTEDQSVFARDPASESFTEITRADMAFPAQSETQIEDEWTYDYSCAAYSPTENHRLMQLQKLQQFASILFGNPALDQVALYKKLASLLEIDDIKVNPQAAQQPPQPGQPGQQPPGAAGAAAPQGGTTPQDTPANGGGQPPGLDTEYMLPPNARAEAAQPKV